MLKLRRGAHRMRENGGSKILRMQAPCGGSKFSEFRHLAAGASPRPTLKKFTGGYGSPPLRGVARGFDMI